MNSESAAPPRVQVNIVNAPELQVLYRTTTVASGVIGNKNQRTETKKMIKMVEIQNSKN